MFYSYDCDSRFYRLNRYGNLRHITVFSKALLHGINGHQMDILTAKEDKNCIILFRISHSCILGGHNLKPCRSCVRAFVTFSIGITHFISCGT